MRRLPSLNALRAFEAAGRHGRMTLAAKELHVTHSAISRQVQHLEDLLGVALFSGPKNGIQLTSAGSTLLTGLSVAFDQMDMAVRSVADTADGPLNISCPGTFTMRWLIPRLFRFNNANPAIEVRLSASSQPVDFQRDSFDVAIRATRRPWPEDAEVTELLPERIGPVLSPSLHERLGRSLDKLTLLHTRSRRNTWDVWRERSTMTVPDGDDVEYEHFYFMIEAALSGLGMCVAPWPMVADDVGSGRLIAPHGFVDSGQTYVAARRSRQHRKSQIFCEWLAEEAKRFEASTHLSRTCDTVEPEPRPQA
ncbi:LysR substrate-binding domain-containing protein [Aureimonas leprariae]|uniref:LysR family transcriptional regulator n=1 Tax=Plantimonas leprariae TaxID=2615207 RepID=A0A7V7PLY6_9HYPH|nr:LysR substrate-binding domain-containing protein [Aureimonas leprariae]KAB0677564.1 LysR family transcriptional regulator [Aureimonas leprariae]